MTHLIKNDECKNKREFQMQTIKNFNLLMIFRVQKKLLNPIETAYDLCVDSCCLLDNMNIFNAENICTSVDTEKLLNHILSVKQNEQSDGKCVSVEWDL